MKVLNLSKIAPKEIRKLSFGDTEYVVNEMSVANFIETTRVSEELANNASLATQIEATVDMVLRSVPTVPKEELEKLTLEQLQIIVAFIRGDEDVEGVEKTEEAGK